MERVGTKVLVGLGGAMTMIYLAPFALVASIVTLIGRGLRGLHDLELDVCECAAIMKMVMLFIFGVIFVFLFKSVFDVYQLLD